jgi:hypothetical protein
MRQGTRYQSFLRPTVILAAHDVLEWLTDVPATGRAPCGYRVRSVKSVKSVIPHLYSYAPYACAPTAFVSGKQGEYKKGRFRRVCGTRWKITDFTDITDTDGVSTVRDYEVWLSGTLDAANVVLRQFPADEMDAGPVSTQVNAPKSNDAALIERAAQ